MKTLTIDPVGGSVVVSESTGTIDAVNAQGQPIVDGQGVQVKIPTGRSWSFPTIAHALKQRAEFENDLSPADRLKLTTAEAALVAPVKA